MTHSKMTLFIMTLSIMTLSIMTLSITTVSIITLSVALLSKSYNAYYYAECRSADCDCTMFNVSGITSVKSFIGPADVENPIMHAIASSGPCKFVQGSLIERDGSVRLTSLH
jgi:hypothetical protein